MQVKSSFVVGRDKELTALLDYITAGTVNTDLMKDRKKEEDEEPNVDEDLEKEALEGGYVVACKWISLEIANDNGNILCN